MANWCLEWHIRSVHPRQARVLVTTLPARKGNRFSEATWMHQVNVNVIANSAARASTTGECRWLPRANARRSGVRLSFVHFEVVKLPQA